MSWLQLILLLSIWSKATSVSDLLSRVTQGKEETSELGKRVFDFIIVGGGSAGCLLAKRLSNVSEWRVLVLEAGNEENIDFLIPAIPTDAHRPILWNYRTMRNNFSCLKRRGGCCEVRTGKVLGGSTLINEMKYTRGHKMDYDSWVSNESIASIEWKYDNLLPYFKAFEDNGDYDVLINSLFHNRGGELHVQRLKNTDKWIETFSSAFAEFGLRQFDININPQEAIVQHQFTIVNGTRISAANAFLNKIKDRKNLVVKTGATVTRILVDKRENCANGVIYETEVGREHTVYAKREIILTAGAINNVKILHLSGIGPKKLLKSYNISLVQDLPVGLNYRDQVTTGGLAFSLPNVPTVPEETLVESFKQWFDTKSGPLSTRGINQLSAYVQVYDGTDAPDIELVLRGNYVRSDKYLLQNISVHVAEETNLPLSFYNLVNIYPVVLKPKSEGTVTLNKRNPVYGRPVIQANLLKDADDLNLLVDGIDIALQLLDKTDMKRAGVTLAPLDLHPCEKLKNRDLWNCVAKHFTKPMSQPVGTCRMGHNAKSSVVNFNLEVHGIEGLRIADASVMPTHIRGDIYIPTLAIAEKAANSIVRNWKVQYINNRR